MNNTVMPPDAQSESTQATPPYDQPARESNIEAIVAFFESGIKPSDANSALGIELEHTLVHDDMRPVSYSEEFGVAWVLGQLEKDFPYTTRDPEGDLLGVAREGEGITIEPAAQLELSAGPFNTLAGAEVAFNAFEEQLEGIVSPVSQRVLTVGYHPTSAALDLELIPKRRYKFMDLYLGAKGPFGPRMMRGSASTQVSIDYYSLEDCLRKLRLAFALVPLFSLMCDNAPVFEGTARPHKLVRTKIWQHCDPDRCGLVPGALQHDFTLRAYAEYVLDTPAILIPCKTEQWCYSERTFGSIYADRIMTRADVEHAVSLFFNDVRLKTYLEIRPADAMPIPYVLSYAALVKGLFYHRENLDVLDQLLVGVDAAAYVDAQNKLMEQGYDAVVYGKPVADVADILIERALLGLNEDEQKYLSPLAELVAQRVTLADLAEQAKL